MTERTDHAAKALELEESAEAILDRKAIPPHMLAVIELDQARLHAQLALVEQQRMANRIALAVAVRADLKLGGSATDLSDWLHDGGGVLGYFSTDEKEALGFA